MKILNCIIREKNIEVNNKEHFVATYKGYLISIHREAQVPYKGQLEYHISVKNDKNGTNVSFSKSYFWMKGAITDALRKANIVKDKLLPIENE